MQSKSNNWSMTKVGIVAAVVGIVVLLFLLAVMGFAFWSSFFWGLVIGAVVFLVLLLAVVDAPDQERADTDHGVSYAPDTVTKPSSPAATSATSSGAAVTAAKPDADKETPPEPKPDAAGTAATKAVPDADAPVADTPAAEAPRDVPAKADPEPAPAAVKPVAPQPEKAEVKAPKPPKTNPVKAKPAAPAKADATPAKAGTASDQDAGAGQKPETLTAARDGKADDLKKIKGVGPKMEQMCNRMGFFHLDQIAAWTPDEIAWVDQNLEGFRGRVTRDNWVEQAQALAAGGETEFSKKVDKGGVY